jgi:hypothetical protein
MADFATALGASNGASTLLVLFIPSRDRADVAIDQGYWVDEALKKPSARSSAGRPPSGAKAYGVTTPGAASCFSTNWSSSSATLLNRPSRAGRPT